MSQITLYLDDATRALVEQAALADGMSKSRWVAELLNMNCVTGCCACTLMRQLLDWQP
jgi:hypothetical protein